MKNKQLNEIYPWKNETKSDFINRFMRAMGKEYPNVKQRYAVAYSYWNRRNDRKLEEADHTQKAINVFGTTYYKTRAGFMLKDGRLLDLTYGGYGPREDHRNIRDAFGDMDLETESDYLIEFMNEGNIRLIPEIPGIDIVVEPTDRQYATLKNYIDFFIGRNKYFGVQFSNKNGDQVDWKEYNGLTSSAEIILDIKDYFKNKLTEGWYDDDLPWSAHEPQTISELLNTNILYHATYKPYWEEIKKEGFIRPGRHSNWPDIFKTYRYIYLSTEYDNAYSYAETAEDVPEELLDQIVVLEIDANKLDVDSLSADENQIYDSDEDEGRSIEDPLTWIELEYSKPIPVSAIRKVHDESELNESTLAATELLEYIKSNFNISDYYSEGQSYILPNGEFLNLYDGAHIGVDDALYEECIIEEDPYVSGKLVLMDEYNSIRMSDGKYIQTDPYIELPKKLPSNAQLNSLLDFLDSLTDESVWVGVRDNKNVGASYNLETTLPEQVIKNIKRFYSSGVLYEAVKSNSIFNLKKIGMSHYDEWLNSQSARDRDNVKIEIKELSPKEYLEACAEIFGNSFESQKKQVQGDREIIEELQDLIKKSISLNATFLDYVSTPPTQEGRHRMYALAELYGWNKKYPVIVFIPADPERAKRDQLEKQQEKLYKYIDKAVTKALNYTYRNYDELKDQISYYLENYINNPKVKISERGHWLVITVNGLEYEISQDEFDWDEDKPDPDDEFDLTWRDLTLEDWNLLLSKNILVEDSQLTESGSRGETTLRKLLIEIAKQLNLPNYDPAQTYVLHHYDEDHSNNNLTNLTLMPSSLHSSMHHRHNITPEWKKTYEDSIVHIGEVINDVLAADEREASK